VTTGAEKPSTYHYVFEFIKEWQIDANQIIDVVELNENRALDRHLVFFYHTRPPSHEFFKPRVGDKSYFQIAVDAKPISTLVASFGIAPGFEPIFDAEVESSKDMELAYLVNPSRTAKEFFGSKFKKYCEILENRIPENTGYNPSEHLLISYYFRCPYISSPLIWYNGPRVDGGTWNSLFPS